MRPEKSDIVFPVGQFKGLTFWNVCMIKPISTDRQRRMALRAHTVGNGYNGLTDTLTSMKLVFSCELLHTMHLIHA